MDLSVAAITSFTFADVRRLAKRRKKELLTKQEKDLTSPSDSKSNDVKQDPVMEGFSLEDCNALLEPPICCSHFMDIWHRNASLLERDVFLVTPLKDKGRLRDYLQRTIHPYRDALQLSPSGYDWEAAQPQRSLQWFDGDAEGSSDCVHAVFIDQKFKRIVLAFRGSVTLTDWMQDAQCVMAQQRNPLLGKQHIQHLSTKRSDASDSADTQPKPQKEDVDTTIGIHLGFRDYLYRSRASNSRSEINNKTIAFGVGTLPVKNPLEIGKEAANAVATTPQKVRSIVQKVGSQLSDHTTGTENSDHRGDNKSEESVDRESTTTAAADEENSKLSCILNQLKSLKEKRPGYRICITGHSLGGALALITALEVAADPLLGSSLSPSSNQENAYSNLPPVTCITIGNPKPGNQQFVRAISQLEDAGLLHCLCFHNKGDVVPLLPRNQFKRDAGFWHVGFRCVLYQDGTFELGRAEAETPLMDNRHLSKNRGTFHGLLHFLADGLRIGGNNNDKQSLATETNDNPTCDMSVDASVWDDTGTTINDEPDLSVKQAFNDINNVVTPESATTETDPQATTQTTEQRNLQKQKQKQNRLNMHDYREYCDRILKLNDEFCSISLPDLYQRHVLLQERSVTVRVTGT